MKDLLESLQKLVPWAAGLALAPKLLISFIVLALAAFALVLIWTPAKNDSPPVGIDVHDRATARYGVTLGWHLGRFEIIDNSPFPEVQQVAPELKRQIQALLQQDKFPHTIDSLNAPQAIDTILTYYGTTNLTKHAFVLLGIAAQRTSLVGASRDPAANEEMKQLAASAVGSMDSSVIRDRESLARELLSHRPKSVDEVLDVFEKWTSRNSPP
jgi:hypothetical protein